MGLFSKKKTEEEKREEKEREDKMDSQNEVDFLICPHCEDKIKGRDGILTMSAETNSLYVEYQGCPHCKKILGTKGEL